MITNVNTKILISFIIVPILAFVSFLAISTLPVNYVAICTFLFDFIVIIGLCLWIGNPQDDELESEL